MPDHSYFANLIWQIADLLRGPYRPPQYERGMLAEAQNYLREHHREARLYAYGQDYNSRAFATARRSLRHVDEATRPQRRR